MHFMCPRLVIALDVQVQKVGGIGTSSKNGAERLVSKVKDLDAKHLSQPCTLYAA